MDNNNDKPGINEYGVPDNPESKLTGNEVFFDNKAKKMLFGKDITKMMLDTPVYGVENGEGVEYEFKNENRPRTDIGDEKLLDGVIKLANGGYSVNLDIISREDFDKWQSGISGAKFYNSKLVSQWNDPEMTGDITDSIVRQEFKLRLYEESRNTPPIDTSMDIQNEKIPIYSIVEGELQKGFIQQSDPIELICTKCHNNFYMGLEQCRMNDGPAICASCLNGIEFAKNVDFIKLEELASYPSEAEISDRKYWRDATKTIQDYCLQNNVPIEDLIRCHKWALGRMPIDWKPKE